VNRSHFSSKRHQVAEIVIFSILVLATSQAGRLLALPPGQAIAPGSGPPSPSNATASSFVEPPRDALAMSILNQVLVAGGGAQAIAAVSDYTAAGNVTTGNDKGSITIRGLHGWEFRMDINGSAGAYSSGVHQGKIFTKAADGTVDIPQQNRHRDRFALPVWTPMFPAGYAFQSAFVAHVLSGKAFGVLSAGTAEINGHSAYDIRITAGPFPAATQSGAGSLTTRPSRDLFIDASTFQIVAFRETVPRNPTHEIDYSNFKLVNGVLMPFAISESFGGHVVATIQIDQITFNSGLVPSAFSVQ
jgi:hypothetical protein